MSKKIIFILATITLFLLSFISIFTKLSDFEEKKMYLLQSKRRAEVFLPISEEKPKKRFPFHI